MLTSRAEHRLLLRQDNADLRLMRYGAALGLIDHAAFEACEAKRRQIADEIVRLKERRQGTETAAQLLKRPDVAYRALVAMGLGDPALSEAVTRQVELELKYEGYLAREAQQVARFRKLEGKRIPLRVLYREISGLRREAREKLEQIQPASIGQAGRISGVSLSDLSAVLIYLERQRRDDVRSDARAGETVTETVDPSARTTASGRGLVPRLRSALVPSEAEGRVEGLAQDSAPRALPVGLHNT